ncbi:hypothetical protein [Fimbriimonas ginsengisoli]|uniref:Uncharacterized protein n=1 Tax=Fimbriimonas ginsengisoli Gsoil 348 TaxID=661478 RepID=A0A068NZ59_FIMGI|nr:hypothetical protein [Fimbriimonas ginsengisoli]AIE88004.1 hypothetical protein OP10G_4636 [Fimbriimonas ginsengisoli Gsoil 348]
MAAIATSAGAQSIGTNGIIYVGDRVVRQSIASTAAVSQVSAGDHHVIVLKADSSVVAWGSNDWGQCDVPKGLVDVTQVSAAGNYSLLLMSDGTVKAFGYGLYGQTTLPVGLANVKQVAAGTYGGVALKNDGTVVCWGDNSAGQLNVPVGLTNVVQVAAGDYSFAALKSNGTVVCWGSNAYGECNLPAGLGTVKSISASAQRVGALLTNGTVVCWGGAAAQNVTPAGLTGVVQIAVGPTHTVALKADHSIVSWGLNYNGETTPNPYAPGATKVAAGARASYAIDQNGQVDGWGESTYGQTISPWQFTDTSLGSITKIAAGYNHLMMVSDWGGGGATRSWGRNLESQCRPNLWFYQDVSGGINHSALTNYTNGWNVYQNAFSGDNSLGQCTPVGSINNYDHLWAVGNGTYGRLKTGGVKAWGDNYWGALNLPSNGNYVQITGGSVHALGLLQNGGVVVAGTNSNHQLEVPPGLANVAQIASGSYHNLALKTDGTVVAWGIDNAGQIDVPAGLTNVVQVGGGENYSMALKSDGSVKTWGAIWNCTAVPAGIPRIGQIATGQHFAALLPQMTMSVYPAISKAGDPVQGTVNLSGPAPAGGVVVKLSSNNANVTVPATVTVPGGMRLATFPVNETDPASPVHAVITATMGTDTQDALETVSAAPFKLTTSLRSFVGGSTDKLTGTITLFNPAPAGGATIALKVSDPINVSIPASVSILAGQKTVTFDLPAVRVHASEMITVTATYAGTTRTQTSNLAPFAVKTLVMSPKTVLCGANATATVTLNATPTASVLVNLTSSNTAMEADPGNYTIAANTNTGTFKFPTNKNTVYSTVTIKGAVDGNGVGDTINLQPALTMVTMPSTTVYGNEFEWIFIHIALPAPAGGFNVNIQGTNCTYIQYIQIPAGASVLAIPVTAFDVSAPTQMKIDASVGPHHVIGTVTIQPNIPSTLTLSPTSVQGSASTAVTGTVKLSAPVDKDTVVNLLSSNTTVVKVPATVTVLKGNSSATFTCSHFGVGSNVNVTITASHAGGSKAAVLTVLH